jgi:hypothetical protein
MAEKEAALAAAQAEQERIAAEEPEVKPAKKATAKKAAAKRTTVKKTGKFSISDLPVDSAPDLAPFAVTQARQMLKAGYNVRHVIERTKVGWEELSDLPIDEDGYGNSNLKVLMLVDKEDDVSADA